MPKHVVADGECLTSIAAQYGFADGKPIIDHPTALRALWIMGDNRVG